MHYLNLLNKKNLYSFAFISSSKKVFTINENGNLVECPLEFLKLLIQTAGEHEHIDLDAVFVPKNTLVSPLNSTDRFLRGDYLLTENQENIKNAVLASIKTNTQGTFLE